MRTLYLDCGMGAAGDMLTAALLELMPDPREMVDRLNALSIPDVHFSMEPSVKCGITGTHVSVRVHGEEESPEMYEHDHDHEHGHHHHDHDHDHDHEHGHDHHHHDHDHEHGHDHHHHDHDHEHSHGHVHHGMADIDHIIRDHLVLPDKVREDVINVFGLIAEAESHVHGVPVTEIHFHEVGTMDAVADITAVCLLMHELSPDEVIVSPVHTGCGQVKCAHGILPVPAPATAYILQDVPIYGGEVRGELCTPTGAALLKYFATGFGNMPVMKTQAIGYGMGVKDFPMANCVRAMLGERQEKSRTVTELSCNVDDMTAEAAGYAMEKLFEGGALDVYTVPIGMKKGRPGLLLRVMCRPEDKENIIRLIFLHTSTIGIREASWNRHVLKREIQTLETPLGTVHRKVSSGYGVKRTKYEYEDLARLADERGCSLQEILALLENG